MSAHLFGQVYFPFLFQKVTARCLTAAAEDLDLPGGGIFGIRKGNPACLILLRYCAAVGGYAINAATFRPVGAGWTISALTSILAAAGMGMMATMCSTKYHLRGGEEAVKFCKRFLLATTAVSLTLLLSVAGSAQAQQRCQTDGQERKIHLHLSDPQLPEELVCEVIDEFTDRYSEQLAQWTHQGQSVQHTPILHIQYNKKSDLKQVALKNVGTALFSRAVTRQVFSTLMSLTTVFGMGTGGSSSPLAPTILL